MSTGTKLFRAIISVILSLCVLFIVFLSIDVYHLGKNEGISVNGDLIIGDGASVNVSVEEDSATLVECVRVNGLIDVGAGAALTASTAKSYAVECYGAIKLCDNAVLSAASEDSEADVICYGAVVDYGADVNGEIEALGQIYDKSEK